MKFYYAVVLILIFSNNLLGQDLRNVRVIIDSTINTEGAEVFVFQNEKWVKYNLSDSFYVKHGMNFDLEFSISHSQFKGLKNLKLFNDTIIILDEISLDSVVVIGKRPIIKQTLRGFEYSPTSDSIFIHQPILYALQRLPFVSIVDDQIKYRNESKIWYRINGKDRRTLEDNWSSILLSLKTSTVIRVDLITDLPLYIKNKDYDVIINIVTEESNFKGIILNSSAILDSRKNLNKNVSLTIVTKKNDYAFSYNNNEDQYTNQKVSKTVERNDLLATHQLENDYQTDNQIFNFKMGRRIDSLHDIAVSIRYRSFHNSNFWKNKYNFPEPLNDFRNINVRKDVNANLSYLFAKARSVENSISFAFRNGKEVFNNHIPHITTRLDSINRTTESFDKILILEFNHRNVTKRTFRYEYGMQLYGKQLSQNYYLYAHDSTDTKFLVENKEDTLLINQFGVRPYFRLNRSVKNNKMYVFELDVEYFKINVEDIRTMSLILPSVLIQKKSLINNSNSLTITGEFMFLKPGDNFYKLIQSNGDPVESRKGSIALVPSKNLELKMEWIRTGTHSLSNEVGILYEYDILNFYTNFDVSTNLLQSFSNNDATLFAIYWKPIFDYSKKKLSFSIGPEFKWLSFSNKIDKQKFDGFVASGNLNGNLLLSKKLGNIGFVGTFSSNPITYQGNSTGQSRYLLYFSKRFFKNKIITTLSAENFFLKERKWNYVNENESYINTIQITRPYRLFYLRIAFNFSNLKNTKISRIKTLNITNEVEK